MLVAVPAPDALLVGPPCKDFSSNDNNQKHMAGCVDNNVGVSGAAVHVVKRFIEESHPMWLILEQVAGSDQKFEKHTLTNWDHIMQLVRDQGYNLRSMDATALTHVPQRRLRTYLVAIHEQSCAERVSKLVIHADQCRSLDQALDETQALVAAVERARLPPDLAFDGRFSVTRESQDAAG